MEKLVLILPVLSGVMWGSTGPFVRVIQDFGFDQFSLINVKMFLTTVILLVALGLFDRKLLKVKLKDLWLFAAAGIVGMLMLNLGYNQAIEKLTLSLAAVLLSMSPIFVMICARIFLKEEITKRKVIGTFFAIVGCAMVSGVLEGNSLGNASAMGVILGIAAAVFYGSYTIFSKILMTKGYNVFTVTFYSTLFGTIVLTPKTDWHIIGQFVSVSPLKNAAFLVAFAVCTTILPYVLYTVAMNHAEAGKVAILGAGGEPSSAMIFGWIFYHEVPSLLSILGLAVTIVALAFICLPGKPKHRR